MKPSIIALSGPMAAGKSTLAKALKDRWNIVSINTREVLNTQTTDTSKGQPSRHDLQQAGQQLDRKTKGKWVLDLLERKIKENPKTQTFVVDCIRNPTQLQPIRQKFGAHATLVHLISPQHVLAARYKDRGDKLPYAKAAKHPSESRIKSLRNIADLVIDTTNTTPDQATHIIAAHMLGIPDCAI